MQTEHNIRSVIKTFQLNALGGRKIPHGVSNPVFRYDENRNLIISAFVYTYSAEELRSRSVKRPSKWMAINVQTGEFIAEYDCGEKDFCTASMEAMCDLNAENDTKYSPEYTNQTLAIFDLILRKYLKTGKFDKELNDAYMYMMLNMVSKGFKEFYRQLNNV